MVVMPGFFHIYTKAFFRPAEAFKLLLLHNRYMRLAAYAISLTAIVYTLVYVFLVFGGGQPYKPWLNISPDKYYTYNRLFCAPSMFAGWILAAGTVHMLTRLMMVDKGQFEQLAATFAFGISMASWTTAIHDLITSFLGAIHLIDQHHYEILLNSPTIWRTLLWVLMMAYLFAFIIYFSISVRVVYELSRGKSVFLGALGFIVYQLFFFIFNR
jgi:hypothetical protein